MCNWECKNWDALRCSSAFQVPRKAWRDYGRHRRLFDDTTWTSWICGKICGNCHQQQAIHGRLSQGNDSDSDLPQFRVTVVCDGSSTGLPFFQYYHEYFRTTTLFIGILPLTWLKQPTFGNHMKHLQTLPDRVLPSENCFTRIGLQVTPSTWLDRVDWSAPIRRCEQLP